MLDTKALFKLTNGMYVVCSTKNGTFNGQIADVVFQVNAVPPTIAVSIATQNLTHEFITSSRVFTVSVLAEDTPMTFIGKFGFKSGRDTDKFRDTSYVMGVTGAPVVLDHAIAAIEAEVISSLEAGDHTIFVGKVVSARITGDAKPMTYAYYHEVKKGLTPKAAPTYNNEEGREDSMSSENMPAQGRPAMGGKKYRCTVCGYVYDPQKGDPDNGVKPGTPFEQLPDSWVCPVCGADKSAFEPLE